MIDAELERMRIASLDTVASPDILALDKRIRIGVPDMVALPEMLPAPANMRIALAMACAVPKTLESNSKIQVSAEVHTVLSSEKRRLSSVPNWSKPSSVNGPHTSAMSTPM